MSVAPDFLRSLLRYQPASGLLFWQERLPLMFSAPRFCASWNTRYAGKEAFTATDKHGYRVGKVLDRSYFAHRVIWAMQTGAWPEQEVDHRDTDRSNNRWDNLREATHTQNMQNSSSRSGATSQYLGVSWSTTEGKWRADISVNGKQRHLGWFTAEAAAALAYDRAAAKYRGVFAHRNIFLERGE